MVSSRMNSCDADIHMAVQAMIKAWNDPHKAHIALEGLDSDNKLCVGFEWEQVADVRGKANE